VEPEIVLSDQIGGISDGIDPQVGLLAGAKIHFILHAPFVFI
jgi:hypothetical protein